MSFRGDLTSKKIKMQPSANRGKILILLVVISIIASILISFVFWKNLRDKQVSNTVDCIGISRSANSYLSESEYLKASEMLKSNYQSCVTQKNDNSRVIYLARLSVAQYNSGQTDDAKYYAEVGSNIQKQLSDEGKAQMANYDSTAMVFSEIKDGSYSGKRGVN